MVLLCNARGPPEINARRYVTLKLDESDLDGLPEGQSSPLDRSLWRAKRRRSFINEPNTEASNSQGLSQEALDLLTSAAPLGFALDAARNTRPICEVRGAGVAQAFLDILSVTCDSKVVDTDACLGDDVLLRSHRTQFFAGRTQKREKATSGGMTQAALDSIGEHCSPDASQPGTVPAEAAAQILRVRRMRSFRGADEAAAMAAAAMSNAVAAEGDLAAGMQAALPTVIIRESPAASAQPDAAAIDTPKMLEGMTATCARHGMTLCKVKEQAVLSAVEPTLIDLGGESFSGFPEATFSSPRRNGRRKRRPMRLSIVVEDDISSFVKPNTPSNGGA